MRPAENTQGSEGPVANDHYFSFSKKAQDEVVAFIKSQTTISPELLSDPQLLFPLDSSSLPNLVHETEGCRQELEFGKRYLVVKALHEANQALNLFEHRLFTWILANLLGEPLIQNEKGDRLICVYDRDRLNSMGQGARYHQTREGGSIHTDNVNVPYHWEYMALGCVAPAYVGGENILVDGLKLHQRLKEKFPDALAILERPFMWECRGIADATYEAPIIIYNDRGEPLFRHLRPYMESAHKKVDLPLTAEQIYALDTLDALLESSEFQLRTRFLAGEVLICYDSQVFHGRTCFSDAFNALSIVDYDPAKGAPLKRTLDRIWCKKRENTYEH